MITIRQLREAIAEIVSTIPEINKTRFVVSDDQMANTLETFKNSENTMLVCLVPTYQSFASDEDITGYVSFMQFFLVDKLDYKTKSEDDFTEVFIKIQEIVQTFILKLFEYQIGDCLVFGNLQQNSIVIRPVLHKAQCNGWEIQIDDKTYSGIDGLIEE